MDHLSVLYTGAGSLIGQNINLRILCSNINFRFRPRSILVTAVPLILIPPAALFLVMARTEKRGGRAVPSSSFRSSLVQHHHRGRDVVDGRGTNSIILTDQTGFRGHF